MKLLKTFFYSIMAAMILSCSGGNGTSGCTGDCQSECNGAGHGECTGVCQSSCDGNGECTGDCQSVCDGIGHGECAKGVNSACSGKGQGHSECANGSKSTCSAGGRHMGKCNSKKIMNAVIDNIMSRRSIRNYKQQAVSRDTLMKIMECGINAPNGQNKQSWEVRVVDTNKAMDEIKALINKGQEKDLASCFRDAPVMVFIARDLGYDFSAYDCGLLAQNIVLSANSLGVGSICLGSPVRIILDSPNRDKILSKLGFSEGYELSLCVGLGYPNEQPEAKPRDRSKVQFVD